MRGTPTTQLAEEARRRAERRVGARLGFLGHLALFALANLALGLLNALATPSFWWFYWPLLGWAIALLKAISKPSPFKGEGRVRVKSSPSSQPSPSWGEGAYGLAPTPRRAVLK